MKTTDLQIGDFITFQKSTFNVDERTGEELGYVYIPEVGKVCALNDIGNVWVNDSEGQEYQITVDEIEPIPLTPEILEKNNDILYGELPILFDDGKMHYSIVECRYVSKEYERNGETFYCLLSSCAYNGGSFVTPFAKIRYVHELQHALKLCGIEKEIVL